MLAGPFGGVGLQLGVYRLSRTSRRASRVRFDNYFFFKKKGGGESIVSVYVGKIRAYDILYGIGWTWGDLRGILCILVIYPSRSDCFPSPIALASSHIYIYIYIYSPPTSHPPTPKSPILVGSPWDERYDLAMRE